MKEGIHPKYQKAIVKCACGETFETGSTKGELKVEICSKCHPFYTGKQKLVDTGGRVDKFKKRYGMYLSPRAWGSPASGKGFCPAETNRGPFSNGPFSFFAPL